MTAPFARAATLHVGPNQRLTLPSQAATLARDGDVVEIDAGEYRGDVAVWTQSALTIRGRGGMARLIADGRAAEQKAIWVIRGGDIRIEQIEFTGARVIHRNGAGIRFEKGRLQLSHCRFIDNENGILTGGNPDSQLDIEFSEFGHNGDGSGYTHNIYAGAIGRLRVTGSYFHHARVGHLLKSRAQVNDISYNRLTDETDGRASYELEFPNGGTALVMGNIIEQSATTENPSIISYGAEGLRDGGNQLVLVHNTIVDRRFFAGTPLVVHGKPGEVSVTVINNLLMGSSPLKLPAAALDRGNQAGSLSQIGADYRPLDRSRWKVPAENLKDMVLPPLLLGRPFPPTMEYLHPMRVVPLADAQRGSVAGALQSAK
ncbi:hypothetical protein VVD49_14430 [Uliginosibacterium sp. H3]|uniref:Right handed beta helix domain-containing protein n=1 Tax=Uliginosibacterium silvisoli TaxID=3114758 RepID=A0ABU6K4U1_9RHOO|nr:hypothetical protein [Uliginosibacterium sp. H3]